MTAQVFGCFRGLVNYETFSGRILAISAALEQEAEVVATIDRAALGRAYLDWIGHYFLMMQNFLMMQTWRSHRDIPLMITALIQAIHRADIVAYALRTGPVISRYGFIVTRYSNEITALAFGATVYSDAIRRFTGQDPSCALTAAQIEAAARQLRSDPSKAKRF